MPTQPDQKLAIAVGPYDGGIHRSDDLGATQLLLGKRDEVISYLLLKSGVPDDALTLVDRGLTGFELRFDQGD